MAQMTCERCGAVLPDDARFCPRCGAPVTAFITEERKVVTMLFADLARSTELESLRGRAEKFVGDAVMAVWGVPHAHADDALRAVRAAFAIRDRTVRLGA